MTNADRFAELYANRIWGFIIGKVRNMALSLEERLALFDANTKWLDDLQAEQLIEAKAKGTNHAPANRGWTREDIYEDRGFPRRRQKS